MSRIVVGIDGSENAERALRWAIEEARLRGASLELVHAVPQNALPGYPAPAPGADFLRDAAQELIDRTVSEVDTGDIDVERLPGSGSPARRLCEVADGAELLVVGARGLGGLRGLLLGSVTQQVVAHAPCPVVVVVPEGRARPAD